MNEESEERIEGTQREFLNCECPSHRHAVDCDCGCAGRIVVRPIEKPE